jgi:hypothetical protein
VPSAAFFVRLVAIDPLLLRRPGAAGKGAEIANRRARARVYNGAANGQIALE